MYSAVRLIGTATAAARQTERQNAHAPGCSRLPMVRNPASMQCTRAHHQLKTPEWGAHVLDNTPPCGREPPKMQTERGSCSAGCKRGGKHKVEDALCNLRNPVTINRGRHGIPHSTHNVASTAAARRGRVANRTRSIKKVSFRTHLHHSAPAQRPSRGANRTQRGVVSTRWRMPFATYAALCQLTVVDTESPTVRTASRAQQQQEEGGKPHAQHQEVSFRTHPHHSPPHNDPHDVQTERSAGW
jgi:hypothetical protein